MDCKEPSLTQYFWNKVLTSLIQGTSQKRGQKDYESQNIRKFAVRLPFWKWLPKEDLNKDNINRHSNAEKRKYHEDKRTIGNA